MTVQEKIDYILTKECTEGELHLVKLAQKRMTIGGISDSLERVINTIYEAKGGSNS